MLHFNSSTVTSYASSRRHSNRCFISTPPPSPTCLCNSSFGSEEHEEVHGDGLRELTQPSSIPLLCSNRVCHFDAVVRSDPTLMPVMPSALIASDRLDLLDDADKMFGFSITSGFSITGGGLR
jgi:hypothetical protein